MKYYITLIVGVCCIVWGSQASAQALPYEFEQVKAHCRKGAPFFHVTIDMRLPDGTKSKTHGINCLSGQDGLLVTMLCHPSTKTCVVSRERGSEAEAIEESLRLAEQEQRKRSERGQI